MARDPQAEHQRVIAAMKLQLDAMSPEQIDTDKTLAKMVTQELNRAKKATVQAFRSSVKSDPRQTYRSIKVQKYKKKWGGNINILDGSKKKVYTSTVISGRQRVRPRHYSESSKDLDSYYGESRAFVARALQRGTKPRIAGGKNSRKGGSGNRGSISPRNFMATAQTELDRSAQQIAERYMLIIKKMKEKYDGKG